MRENTITRGGQMSPPRTPAANDGNAQRWAAWLRGAMERRFGRDFHNVDLARASHGEIKENTVSRWLRATLADAPSVKLVRAAALALDADQTEALTAAGHLIPQAPPPRRSRQGSPAAQRWAAWLRERAEERGMDRDYFMEITQPEKPFDEETLKRWWDGGEAPDPVNAALFGVILDIDPVDALRAAGHDDLADLAAALRGIEDLHVRRATQLVADPATRAHLIAEYNDRVASERRHAGEMLELKAKAARDEGADPTNVP